MHIITFFDILYLLDFFFSSYEIPNLLFSFVSFFLFFGFMSVSIS